MRHEFLCCSTFYIVSYALKTSKVNKNDSKGLAISLLIDLVQRPLRLCPWIPEPIYDLVFPMDCFKINEGSFD